MMASCCLLVCADRRAGDGTTTSILMTQALVNQVRQHASLAMAFLSQPSSICHFPPFPNQPHFIRGASKPMLLL
jgi:hypothetical protein